MYTICESVRMFLISLDINECERASHCQRGRCINTMGSYRCECQKGYMLVSGRRCQGMGFHTFHITQLLILVLVVLFTFLHSLSLSLSDIDECAVERSLCQPHGVCQNRQGGYVCVCNDGFRLSEDKHSCEGESRFSVFALPFFFLFTKFGLYVSVFSTQRLR